VSVLVLGQKKTNVPAHAESKRGILPSSCFCYTLALNGLMMLIHVKANGLLH
jgi:hypothetical protein